MALTRRRSSRWLSIVLGAIALTAAAIIGTHPSHVAPSATISPSAVPAPQR